VAIKTSFQRGEKNMEAIREQISKPWVVFVTGLLIGLIIGLPILGWWLWPVTWKDAAPEHLRREFKEIYLRLAIDSYTVNANPDQARQRIQEVGPDATSLLEEIVANPGTQNPGVAQAFLELARGGLVAAPSPGAPATTQAPSAPASTRSLLSTVLPIMCLITFLLAGGLVAAFLLRDRIRTGNLLPARKTEAARQPAAVPYPTEGGEPPIAQFMTSYNVGNDLYDDSFSIDSQAGEFLGECGVGISETIGVGDPKRVTAFEVWLFDKNDIQTVTQVLMSQHAFTDETTRQRLAAKGEPVLAETGHELVLETATLRLIARIVDMSYGSGALPSESFFDRLTLEMMVWAKS
jgi:hypothetical protein